MATNVFCADRDDVDAVAHFAIAFNNQHVGIVFRGEQNKRLFWHLGAHNEVWLDEAKPRIHRGGYGWIIPSLSQIELRGLANFSAQFSEKIRAGYPLPYGVRYLPHGYRFRDDLTVEFEGMSGFTCATFVLSVFDCLIAPPLLDRSSWVKRKTDENSFRMLVKQAVGERATQEYVAKLMDEIPTALRFHPHEVAGACLEENRPVKMSVAEKRADEIRKALADYEDRRRHAPRSGSG